MLPFTWIIKHRKGPMLNSLHVLDAREFLPRLREVLKRATQRTMPHSSRAAVEFTVAEHKDGTTTWRLQVRGHTTLLLRLVHMHEILIECHDRDVFDACLSPVDSFVSLGETSDGRTYADMTTKNFPVTIVYHDNDTYISR